MRGCGYRQPSDNALKKEPSKQVLKPSESGVGFLEGPITKS